MLSCYRTFKWLKRYFCTYARGWISRLKNTTTFKFAHDLPVAVFYATVFAKKIFSNWKYFFLKIYKLLKQMVYLEVSEFEKKYFRLENIFLRIPSPRMPRQVGRVHILTSWYFFKRDILPRGISAKVPLKMYENITNFTALPIVLPNGDSWGFSICHS